MRKLTITRRKAFAGCLGKVKIYIQDPNGDEEIRCTRCRLLGKLKNGQSASFEIGNDSYKIFAIYDEMSKNYCNDFYTVPEGEEDFYITGKAHFNPFGGNPFYFDDVADKTVLANRKDNKKKSLIILISVIVGVVIGLLVTWLFFSN